MVTEIVISVILLFVGVAVLVVIHICIVGRAFRRGLGPLGIVDGDHFVRSSSSSISAPKGTGLGMSSEDLKKLPWFDYKADGNTEKGGSSSPVTIDCAVCLEIFLAGDKCRLLPNCQHFFHVKCIDLWLIKMPVCPICRTCAKISKVNFPDDSDNGQAAIV